MNELSIERMLRIAQSCALWMALSPGLLSNIKIIYVNSWWFGLFVIVATISPLLVYSIISLFNWNLSGRKIYIYRGYSIIFHCVIFYWVLDSIKQSGTYDWLLQGLWNEAGLKIFGFICCPLIVLFDILMVSRHMRQKASC